MNRPVLTGLGPWFWASLALLPACREKDPVSDTAELCSFYEDLDGDGYGAGDEILSYCSDPPPDSVLVDGDCDDSDASRNPGQTEVPYDGLDNDCRSGTRDDDLDRDGVDAATDCDDDDPANFPGGTEICDDQDNDCDGEVDGPGSEDATTWYLDSDVDGYGDALVSTVECSKPTAHVRNDDDCDDTDAEIRPDATEVCNGVDDDCDALIDGADPSVDHPSACQLVGDISLSNTGAKLTGEASSDYAGVSVANAGDVNSDGYGDLLVGAYGEDIDGLGAAYVVLGPVTGDASLSTADAKLSGENAGDYAGWCVSTAGDVDNDGYDDVLVGAYGEDSGGSNAGAAYLVLGPISGTMTMASADGKFTGEFGGDQAGVSVSDAGDVDNDGQGDFLVGAPGEDTGGSYAGAAYLFYGPVKGNKSLSRADAKLTGASAGDYAGWSVSSAGDVDGDGLDDILVGARYESTGGANAGAVYLVHGPLAGDLDLASADAIRTGEASDDLAGWSISGAGDVDNDGHADVVIGAPGEDSAGTSAGAAYLVHGPFNGTSSLADSDAKFTGESSEDDAGYSVSTAGDSDLDGRSDILVGARYEDSVAADAGAAYLLYGPLSGSRSLKAAAAKLSGESADDNAGWSVSTAEDVNGDGHSDLLMGAYGEDSGGAKAGAVYLVFGSVY